MYLQVNGTKKRSEHIKQKGYKIVNYQDITRGGMFFFRDDEKFNELTTDDRLEIFRTTL